MSKNTDITNNALSEQDIPISNAFYNEPMTMKFLHITNAKVDYTLPIRINALIEAGL